MFIKNLKLSAKIVKENLLNNFDVFLGAVFCIGIFVVIFCVSKSGVRENLHDFSNLGGQTIKICIDDTRNISNKKYFSSNDVNYIRHLPYIEFISPEISFKASVGNKINSVRTYVLLGTDDYNNFLNMKIIHGRFLTKYECVNGRNVVVIDRNLSLKIFGVENSLGREINIENDIYGGLYKVIGVVKGKLSAFSNNYFCIIPFEDSLYKFGLHNEFDYMYAYIKGNYKMKDVYRSINNSLRITNYGYEDLYKIENIKDFKFLYGIYNFLKICVLFLGICTFGFIIMYIMNLNMESKIIGLKNCVNLNFSKTFFKFFYEVFIISFSLVFSGVGLGILVSFVLCLVFKFKIYVVNVFMSFSMYFFLGIIFGALVSFKVYKFNFPKGNSMNKNFIN